MMMFSVLFTLLIMVKRQYIIWGCKTLIKYKMVFYYSRPFLVGIFSSIIFIRFILLIS